MMNNGQRQRQRQRHRGRGASTTTTTTVSSTCCSSSTDPISAMPSSSSCFSHSTDLRLGLSILPAAANCEADQEAGEECNGYDYENGNGINDIEVEEGTTTSTIGTFLYVKIYMEGHPIGRKLDLLAHHGFHDLISSLEHMFNTNILWGDEVDRVHSGDHHQHHHQDFHVLTYEDEEGDLMMVGDVPWEMFLSAVKRLKITRAFPC